MATLAEARTDPADLINAAVNALVRGRLELPALRALRRIAGTAHRGVNAAQWQGISAGLREAEGIALDALLNLDEKTQETPFAQLCRGPGRASRDHLKALIDRHEWLQTLPDPAVPLASVSEAKVLQWANEVCQLNARELRRYVKPRGHALLLALLRQARGQVLDDMTQMLLKLARRIEHKSEDRLEEWFADRQSQTDALIWM